MLYAEIGKAGGRRSIFRGTSYLGVVVTASFFPYFLRITGV